MSGARWWMYARIKDGLLNPDFLNGLEEFIAFACSQPEWMDGPRIRCPCNLHRCQNKAYRDVETVKVHLCKKGFVPDYNVWYCHGEPEEIPAVVTSQQVSIPVDEPVVNLNTYEEMVMNASGNEFNQNTFMEEPNPDAQQFYDMLRAANQELYPGCEGHS